MKSIKMVAVGAAAAALILGAGCSQRHDDSVRHDIAQGTGGSGTVPINDTAPSSATVPVSPPVNDSLRGMQDQDAIGHQDSMAKDSLSSKDSIDQDAVKKDLPSKDSILQRDSSTMHSSISTKKHSHVDDSVIGSSTQKPSDLSAEMPSDDLGVGGAGNTVSTPVEDTAPLTVPDNSAISNPPTSMDRSSDTLGSSYTGVPSDTGSMNRSLYQNHRRLNGTLDNETGSRTNTTGSNISTNTNPTEPRSVAKDQVPRR